MGALPYVMSKMGLDVPVYCTTAAHKMGLLELTQMFEERSKFNFSVFDTDSILKTFDSIRQLKHNQEVALSGTGEGITIVPRHCGRLLGGAMWRICKDTEAVVYAVDFNHKNEIHLSKMKLEEKERTTVLITDAYNGGVSHAKQATRKNRDARIGKLLDQTLKAGGNVLIPIGTAGRSLELLQLFRVFWTKTKWPFPLVLLSHVGDRTLQFAQSLLEHMSVKVQKEFNERRSNAFDIRYVCELCMCCLCVHLCLSPLPLPPLSLSLSDQSACIVLTLPPPLPSPSPNHHSQLICFTSRDEFDIFCRNNTTPKCVLATSDALDVGFAKDLFLEWAGNPANCVLFTQRSQSFTLAHQLAVNGVQQNPMQISRKLAVPLTGAELQEHLDKVRLEREQRELELAKAEEESDAEDSEDEAMDDAAATHRRRVKLNSVFPMFPVLEIKRQWDVYGEFVNPNDYMVSEDLAGGADANGAHPMDTSSAAANDKKKKEDQDKLPTKTVQDTVELNIKANIQYIDFEGRSDFESVKNQVFKVEPRRVVILHGEQKYKQELATAISAKAFSQQVVVPKSNQAVDVSSDTNMYRVNLRQSLLSQLDFVAVGDYSVAYAQGSVRIDYKQSAVPMLEAVADDATMGHPALFLGQVKLNDVKRVLDSAGIDTAFCKGVLVCSKGTVNIRKATPTKIMIQGALSADYFKIRQLLYGQYEIV
jgi:cleavage and polyadenylation specificity factor subunit 2